MKAEIFPLEKIKMDNKEILLGMNTNQVQSLIGAPDRIFQNYGESYRHYYFDSELGLDFDENGLLEFIEFLGGIKGKLRPYIYEMSAFEAGSDELLNMITGHDSEIDDSEADFCYSFLNISVGLWRENEEDEHWNTIGIGVKDYYRL